MQDTIPLFTSHYSKCDSLLTLEGDIYQKNDKGEKTKEVYIDEERPISLFAIGAVHKLPQLYIVDNVLAGFWQAYKNSYEFNVPCYYGLKMVVCDDMTKGDDKDTTSSQDTESSVIIFLKNSAAYSDASRIYTEAATKGFDHHPRLDWKTLNALWTPNLMLCLPFYSSFLARNLLFARRSIIPNIDKLDPTFFVENHDLPMDLFLKDTVVSYANANGFKMQSSHSIYYYRTEDHLAYMTLKCIDKPPRGKDNANRAILFKPNLDGHGSRLFSFESFHPLS